MMKEYDALREQLEDSDPENLYLREVGAPPERLRLLSCRLSDGKSE
jgi:hypothetical protein